MLYKLFARLLASRLTPSLYKHQPDEQAGFRKGFSTLDHLFAMGQPQEKAHEWQHTIWFAALDFRKAFDTVKHHCIWEALKKHGVPRCYINLLARMYRNQSGRVRTDTMSKVFDLRRGTKQGDPLSSLLFNAVLEDVMSDFKGHWVFTGRGLKLGPVQVSELRFADDLLLMARSMPDIRNMLQDVVKAARLRGLELHPGKTKVMCNKSVRTGKISRRTLDVNDLQIEILPFSGSLKYLGRLVNLEFWDAVELNNRIALAWKKFMVFKTEFMNKKLFSK